MSLVFDTKFLRLSRRHLPQCIRRLSWERKKRESYQLSRLKSILSYAKQYSSWYKDKLSKIDIDRFTLAQMNNLPILTKDELMENWNEIVTDKSITLSQIQDFIKQANETDNHLISLKKIEKNYQIICSGGSSGRQGIFVYDLPAWINSYNSTVRVFNRDNYIQLNLGKRICKATIAAPFSSHMTSNLTQHIENEVKDVYLPVTQPYEKILLKLNQVSPDIIQGYPSILIKLAQSQKAGEININPKIIVTMGEALYSAVENNLKSTWPVKIYNVWACGEFGPLAITCNKCNNLILANDNCLIEKFDSPISDAVLVTGLHNKLMPLIRYYLEDQIIFGKPNLCCKNLDVLLEISGRTTDVFYYRDKMVHSYCFRSLFHDYSEIINYQVIQTTRGVRFNLEKTLESRSDITESLSQKAFHRLIDLDIPHPEVSISYVSQFQRTQAGKIPRFIPLTDKKARNK